MKADEIQWATAFINEGIEALHIRKPGLSIEAMREYLIPLVEAGFANKLILHSHYSLAAEWALRGIHLKESTRLQALSDDFNSLSLSISTHSAAQLILLPAEKYSYAFLSPIFPSISKPGYSPTLSQSEIANAITQARTPTIALGGITPGRMENVMQMGFAGIAAIGAFWSHSSLQEALRITRKFLIYATR